MVSIPASGAFGCGIVTSSDVSDSLSSSIVTSAVILIADNTDGASGASNVCLQDDDSNVTTIHITGGLTNTTPIGVMKVKYQWITTQDGGHNTYVPIPGVFTSGWTTYMSDKTPANYFISESTYPVEEQDNELVLAVPQPIPYQAASWDSANNKVNYTTESCTDYTVVTSNTTSFEDGKWYVVKDDVTINHRIDDYEADIGLLERISTAPLWSTTENYPEFVSVFNGTQRENAATGITWDRTGLLISRNDFDSKINKLADMESRWSATVTPSLITIELYEEKDGKTPTEQYAEDVKAVSDGAGIEHSEGETVQQARLMGAARAAEDAKAAKVMSLYASR